MARARRKLNSLDISKLYVGMLNEYDQLLAWTRELHAEGRVREAASTFEAAEALCKRIEQFERDHYPAPQFSAAT